MIVLLVVGDSPALALGLALLETVNIGLALPWCSRWRCMRGGGRGTGAGAVAGAWAALFWGRSGGRWRWR